jgi:NAD(P)-dependent dehydrogenase (short-subunit alcohol dehydrogenase family)
MRRVLVTGANKGIGLAIVADILGQHDDTYVLLGSRSLDRGREALKTLVEQHPTWADRAEVIELDVSNDSSVAKAAAHVAASCADEPTPLYGLVNNAGVGFGVGDLDFVLQVNTYGMRRVCEAFLPLIDVSKGRIVNITSASGPNFVAECSPERQRFFVDEEVEWSNLESFLQECLAMNDKDAFAASGLGNGDSYGLSKACANSYTLLLARNNPNIRINACTPGWIETDLTRQYAEAQGQTPADMGMKSPADGTKSTLFLLFGEVSGSGHYYGSDAKRSPLDRYRAPGTPAYAGD